MLKIELTDLAAIGADLSMLGFTKQELAAALEPAVSTGLTDENEVPEVTDVAVTSVGDTWCMESHRLVCGDSTNSDTVKTLLGSFEPHLMVTDPPYGVDYDPAWRHRVGVNKSSRVGKVRNDERADWEAAWALFPGSIAYVWHGALHATTVAESLAHHGFAIRAQIIWAKERLVIGRGDYHWQHEPCWYAVRKKGNWTGDRKQTTLWSISSGGQDVETIHGTQKPVECMRRPMLNNSVPDQAIYDPFLGSGTTLIAAETTKRLCLGIHERARTMNSWGYNTPYWYSRQDSLGREIDRITRSDVDRAREQLERSQVSRTIMDADLAAAWHRPGYDQVAERRFLEPLFDPAFVSRITGCGNAELTVRATVRHDQEAISALRDQVNTAATGLITELWRDPGQLYRSATATEFPCDSMLMQTEAQRLLSIYGPRIVDQTGFLVEQHRNLGLFAPSMTATSFERSDLLARVALQPTFPTDFVGYDLANIEALER
jgi:DNA modification methylase